MVYRYEEIKPRLFTDEGNRRFITRRDKVLAMIAENGAVRMQEAMCGWTGDSWEMIAVFDRMVETGEILCVHEGIATQYRIYTEG